MGNLTNQKIVKQEQIPPKNMTSLVIPTDPCSPLLLYLSFHCVKQYINESFSINKIMKRIMLPWMLT